MHRELPERFKNGCFGNLYCNEKHLHTLDKKCKQTYKHKFNININNYYNSVKRTRS